MVLNRIILNGESQTIPITFDARIVGTGAEEIIDIESGTNIVFNAGVGDRVELDIDLENYSISAQGNQLFLEDDQGGVVTLNVGTSAGATSTVAFADTEAELYMAFGDQGPEIHFGDAVIGDGETLDNAGDVNQGLIIDTIGDQEIAEDTTADTVIADANIDGNDPPEILYSLSTNVEDGNGNDLFAIDENTGEIRLTAAGEAALDFETGPNEYDLGITASDGMKTSDELRFTVNITDVPEGIDLAAGEYEADDAVAETFVYEIDSSNGAVYSLENGHITIGGDGFDVENDNIIFQDVEDGTVTKDDFVDQVSETSDSTIFEKTEVFFADNPETDAEDNFRLELTGVVDQNFDQIDFSIA